MNSFKDTLLAELNDYSVSELVVDREHIQSGLPSTLIKLNYRMNGTLFRHSWSFAKANGMSAEDMAGVIKSYLKETP